MVNVGPSATGVSIKMAKSRAEEMGEGERERERARVRACVFVVQVYTAVYIVFSVVNNH